MRSFMVDSHAHLSFPGLYENLEEKIKIAKLMNVDYILSVSTNKEDVKNNLEIAFKFPHVFASVGIHPSHGNESYSKEELIQFLNNEKTIAIGEVGLDYHYTDVVSVPVQKKLFREMLSFSNLFDLPFIFHARECFDDIFNIIEEYKIKNAVFHCYTDTLDIAKKILDLGYYISFSGAITFKNSADLREVVKFVPLEKILIETDCPYLAPVPYRGKLNEPAYVSLVADCVGEIKNIGVDEIAKQTSDNFFKLFSRATLKGENL